MPRRTDLSTICIIGSGPIVIGQACEFDYSGTQAVKALKSEGFRVVLINSNPATIMTDPELADATYVEPLTTEFVQKVLERERPDALIPTMGGQTSLNLALELHEQGVLDDLGIELLGSKPEVIERAEDREKFSALIESIGLDQPRGGVARSMDEARELVNETGYPVILRPSYTMGGSGGNVAYNKEEFERYTRRALQESPTNEVLVDESLMGWKEFELEMMRDRNDNVVVICGIENIDPMGIHTGDSVTVAPIQTLSDREYQDMRDDAIKIIRAVGVETGGCNIQFATDPETGRRVVIEMNPRVSRSSALASKATGYPIAKVASLLSIGYTLDELTNDITGTTSAAFEPVLDYVVVKVPRFDFSKFPNADCTLTTQMKSVGEAMAIGRTFPEAVSKAFRSLETKDGGLHTRLYDSDPFQTKLRKRRSDRLLHLMDALRMNTDQTDLSEWSGYDPWFIHQFDRIAQAESGLENESGELDPSKVMEAKRMGISDTFISLFTNRDESEVREFRHQQNIRPVFKQVDTCAAEFEAQTSYFYSTYESGENEAKPSDKDTIIVLGGGPNRIGQGIEFDYCAVHAVLGLKEAGYRVVMANCNPETVSTDYDISDRLYFEPLTLESVLDICEVENPVGVVLQVGGQTPLKLADGLERNGINILGSDADIIDLVEDRKRFNQIIEDLELRQPEGSATNSLDEAKAFAKDVGYPLLVRPSYVLGGRAMTVARNGKELQKSFLDAQKESDAPVLLDRFLDGATEIDVDCICDGTDVLIGGVMEHIEEAGVHSGDSACVLPPAHLPEHMVRRIRKCSKSLAKKLEIRGLLNIQYAVMGHHLYILEANPRASRTIPFAAKATGVPLAKIATRVMAGETLKELGVSQKDDPAHFAVKAPVFPFNKFPTTPILLSPEMRSTGEVMGIDKDFRLAYYKAQVAAGNKLPQGGTAFLSVRDRDKWAVVPIAQKLASLGFSLVASRGTASYLDQNGLDVEPINKIYEGQPHVVDAMINGEIDLVVNTSEGEQSREDYTVIRRTALENHIPCLNTIEAAHVAVAALSALKNTDPDVTSLQSLK